MWIFEYLSIIMTVRDSHICKITYVDINFMEEIINEVL